MKAWINVKRIMAGFFLMAGLVFPAYAAVICPHNAFACLERHMEDFYMADHDRFYRVYRSAFHQAWECRHYPDVSRYLSLYSSAGSEAEIEESMQQDTEALLLLKPVCLFEGVLGLNPEQQDNFIGGYHLFSRPHHVMRLLRSYMHGGRYQHIATRIYNANLRAYLSYGKGSEDASMEELRDQYKLH